MKDTLILQNRILISAKRAVSISGYSPDYIGQLCRENKLDCKMVGRSWFVTEDSLLKHRQLSSQESPVEKVKVPQIIEMKSDSVIVDRKNFISTKKASEISGYTCDYVGQLCRSGKLESTRVGNAWFVSEKSILNHCITIAQESSVIEKKPIVVPIIENKIALVPEIKKNDIELVRNKTIDRVTDVSKVEEYHKTKTSSFSKNLILSFGISLVAILIIFITMNSSKFFSQQSQSASVISSLINSPPSLNALAVAPSSGSVSQDEVIKKKIQDSFSDEVIVKPDNVGNSGIVTPVFKKTNSQDFVYVMVPINKTQ